MIADQNEQLTKSQWVLMNAIELGNLDVANIQSDLDQLHRKGLVEKIGDVWRPTSDGRFLIALRRRI